MKLNPIQEADRARRNAATAIHTSVSALLQECAALVERHGVGAAPAAPVADRDRESLTAR